MATNKNQHFVPRCYLRPFSIEGAGIAINLYNIDRQRFIPCAPVKNQCSRDYFYGQDARLERAIQTVEGGYAAALREILKPGYTLTDRHRAVLRTFWLFQHLRTESVAIRVAEMAASVGEVARTTDSSFRLSIKDAVIMGMHAFVDAMHIIDDVKICIVRNRTQVPFFTSDDPAVLTNRWWFSDRRTKQGFSFGLSSAGAIFLLPLSPKLLCLGYDGDVYSIPHERGMVDVRREKDIIAFNEHQFLNCRANIFVQNTEHSNVVHEAFVTASRNRPASRHKINYAVRDIKAGNHVRYRVVNPAECEEHTEAIIHTQVINPVPQGWPTQITVRRKGVVFTNGTGMGYVRRASIPPDSRRPFYREDA